MSQADGMSSEAFIRTVTDADVSVLDGWQAITVVFIFKKRAKLLAWLMAC